MIVQALTPAGPLSLVNQPDVSSSRAALSIFMSSNVPFRTDAVVKGSLNAGLIKPSGARSGGAGAASGAHGAAAAEPTSEAYLDSFQEELHKKVDGDIAVLVDGLQECVQLAKVSKHSVHHGCKITKLIMQCLSNRSATRTASKLSKMQ